MLSEVEVVSPDRGKDLEEEARLAREAEEARRREEAAVAAAREALTAPVHFGYDLFDISPEAGRILSQKVAVMRANPNVQLRIEGHADERGSDEYNLALGLRRATAAQNYLAGFGIDASRFSLHTYGEERPADPGQTEEAYARNRRAEFQITAGADRLVPPSD